MRRVHARHASPLQSRVLRFLTFVCFFNFSGLNNGYSYISQISPVQPSQSFSLLSVLLRDSHRFTGWQGWLRSYQDQCRRIIGVAEEMQEFVAGFWRGGEKAMAADSGHENFGRDTANTRQMQVLSQRKIYLKKEKEVWSKDSPQGRRLMVPASTEFTVVATTVSRASVRRSALIAMRTLLERLRSSLHSGGGDSPDAFFAQHKAPPKTPIVRSGFFVAQFNLTK